MSQLLPLLRFALFICFSLIAVMPVSAQSRWVFIGTSADDSSWYIDKSITEEKSGTITAWEKAVLPNRSFSIGLTEWNCSERKKRILQSGDYAPSGEVLRYQNMPLPWRSVVPDAIEEGIFNVVCAISKKKIAEKDRNSGPSGAFAQIIRKSALMSEASSNGKVIRRVAAGEKLALMSEESTGIWYRVLDPQTNSESWLNGNHFKIVRASKPVRNIGPSKRTKRRN